MLLKYLLEGVAYKGFQMDDELDVKNVQFDSRKVGPSDMFVAQKGVSVDGHEYIATAISKGAKVIVCQTLPEALEVGVSYILCTNSSIALGVIASNFYGKPSTKMKLVGVTGTNGKTTTATLLYEVARLFGHKSGLFSTVCNYIDDKPIHATHTTPDPLEINSLMKKMVDDGCEYCFMEVSSHSAHQHRIAGLDFDGAIFSNITHDHLDYHKTFKNYIEAKKMFFDELKSQAFALTNIDDKNGMVMLQNTKAGKYTYSCKQMSDFMAKIVEMHIDSTLVDINGRQVWTKFSGEFNVYNLLAVFAAASLLGFEKDKLYEVMSQLVPVSGRFQTIVSKSGIVAVVDYAHTPDAVENVLKTLNSLKKNNKIICVLGAGGDRDKTKRPEMAETACKMSDLVVLTSDNPRSENPEDIIDDMFVGVHQDCLGKVIRDSDRKKAIEKAILLAAPGDIVLVAGKGHEDYQEIKGVKHHFDDREIINQIFNNL